MTLVQEAMTIMEKMPKKNQQIVLELLRVLDGQASDDEMPGKNQNKTRKRMMEKEGHSAEHQAAGSARVQTSKRRLGMADGMYAIPDDIDACNDEIARMFGVTE